MFSVWGTFPCYLLHFEAKISALLNLELKFAIGTVHRFFHGFSRCSLIYPKFSSMFPQFFIELSMVSIDFSMVSIDFSMHNMHLANM